MDEGAVVSCPTRFSEALCVDQVTMHVIALECDGRAVSEGLWNEAFAPRADVRCPGSPALAASHEESMFTDVSDLTYLDWTEGRSRHLAKPEIVDKGFDPALRGDCKVGLGGVILVASVKG